MGDLSPVARTYPAGVTCWIDLAAPDVDAAIDFYRALFGWEFEDVLPPEGPFRYVVATLDGLDVASLSGPRDVGAEGGEGPGAWSTYVAVDDADTAAERLAGLGAEVVAAPQDAGPGGRAATLRDPQGAEVRLWQARRRLGAQISNVPGAWNFSDLRTSDPGAAAAFYAEAFGWRVVDQEWGSAVQVPGYGDHLEATVDPDIRTRQAQAPEGFADVIGSMTSTGADEPAHWHVTFTVADRDAAVAAVEANGGEVLATSEDDWTRRADVLDPAGAAFTVSQFAPQEW